jgi:integrase
VARKPKPKTRRTGQGSVYQRKDGRWQGSITVGTNENGYPQRIQVTKPSRDEAVKALNEIIVRLSLGVPPADDGRKLADYLETWLEETVKPHREPKTYKSYEQSVRLHIVPYIGHLTLRKLTAQHVQAMLNSLAAGGPKPADKDDKQQKPLSPATVRNAKAVLRRALNVAQKQRLIAANPALHTEPPKLAHAEPVYLSQEEVAALLKAAQKDRFGDIVSLALMTGLRLGEATGLAWDDVDLEEPAIRVRKQLQRVQGAFVRKDLRTNSSRRNVSLAPSAVAALQDQKARQLLWKATIEERLRKEAEDTRIREEKRAARIAAREVSQLGTPLSMRQQSESAERREGVRGNPESEAESTTPPAAELPNCPIAQLPSCPTAEPSDPVRNNQGADAPYNPLNLVFTNTDGSPLDPKTVADALARMCAAAKITKPISFHKLRHTAATHMAASGVPLAVLKDVLGHSQISLTANTYSHAVPAALRQATDALEKAYQPKPANPTPTDGRSNA